MARPTLTPASTTSAIVLPSASSDSASTITDALPFSVYTGQEFLTGAIKQVSYTYKKLGGDVLDIELTKGQVYAAYEEATLEYSYLVNVHQAKNILPNVLGDTTGTFDHTGSLLTGPTGQDVSLRYPRYEFAYTKRIGDQVATETGIGGVQSIYSASFNTTSSVQDYDLQAIIEENAADSSSEFNGKVNSKRIAVRKVYYKTPHAMWRFFGYYGGLNVVGNLSSYGQFMDESTFQVIPVWQNRAQAAAFEDAIHTRTSHFSYEIKNNKLRIFPQTTNHGPTQMWIEFTTEEDAWDEQSNGLDGTEGINNMNTLPFENLPYANINAIGKQWIRRFALAICKEMLGLIRSKFASIPIPGESVTLNGAEMVSQGKEEQSALREELKSTLDELTYAKLAETDATIMETANRTQAKVPLGGIFMG
jgi:hypothetical protein